MGHRAETLHCEQCEETDIHKFKIQGFWITCLSCRWKWRKPKHLRVKQVTSYCQGCYWQLGKNVCPFQRCVKRYDFSLQATQ
jgi:hypothetical protein